MNVCPEWLCGVVRGAERAQYDSWWKEKGGRWWGGARWKDEGEGQRGMKREGSQRREKSRSDEKQEDKT